MSITEAIENSAFPVWVRESPSIFAYTTFLFLHALGLAIVLGLNAIVALRLLGIGPDYPLGAARRIYPWIYAGFATSSISGATLMAADLARMLASTVLLMKLACVFTGMALAVVLKCRFFDRLPATAGGPDVQQVPTWARRTAMLSLLAWALSLILGRLTAYPGIILGLD